MYIRTDNAEKQMMVIMPKETIEQIGTMLEELKELIVKRNEQESLDMWIDSEKARKFFGVSQKTWQDYRDKRVLPFSQFGRKIYVKRSDIEAFLQSHMVK